MATVESVIKLTLKELRARKGWSQAELARRAGVSQSMIAKIEVYSRSRERIKLQTATLVAKALGVNVEDINWRHDLSLVIYGFEPGEGCGAHVPLETSRSTCCTMCFTELPGTGTCDYCT